MAFLDIETSREDGRPIYLYEFSIGARTWRYTSADETLTAGGLSYQAVAISDDGPRQSGESAADVLKINAPSRVGPAQLWMTGAPSAEISVAIQVKHEGSPDVVTIYAGFIQSINYPIPGQCVITCETLSASMRRQGLRLGYQRACPYATYDPLTCKVDKAIWSVDVVVVSIEGFTAVISGIADKADDYFDGGFMEWNHPVRGIEYLSIEEHTAGRFLLTGNVIDLFPGAAGKAYPVCRHTPESCLEFDAYDNHGGFVDLPGKSPYDGDPVF